MDDPTAQTDEEFRQSLERCTIPNHAFRHRDHLRLAWIYLHESDLDGAMRRLSQSIKTLTFLTRICRSNTFRRAFYAAIPPGSGGLNPICDPSPRWECLRDGVSS